jgi:hypothetical protein
MNCHLANLSLPFQGHGFSPSGQSDYALVILRAFSDP